METFTLSKEVTTLGRQGGTDPASLASGRWTLDISPCEDDEMCFDVAVVYRPDRVGVCCLADVECYIVKPSDGSKRRISKESAFVFSARKLEECVDLDDYLGLNLGDNFIVEANIVVREIQGLKSLVDYSQPNVTTDAVLVVEGERVHVCRGLLARHSPFFMTLFFGSLVDNKAEKEEIELKDVRHEDFVDLLRLLEYGGKRINDLNVKSLLKLADRFDVEAATDACETWLISTKDLNATAKLSLANLFHLKELLRSTLKTMTTEELRAFRRSDDFKSVSPATMSALFDVTLDRLPCHPTHSHYVPSASTATSDAFYDL